jgi:hypothetical protein
MRKDGIAPKEFTRGPQSGEAAADDRDVDVEVLIECRSRRDGVSGTTTTATAMAPRSDELDGSGEDLAQTCRP